MRKGNKPQREREREEVIVRSVNHCFMQALWFTV